MQHAHESIAVDMHGHRRGQLGARECPVCGEAPEARDELDLVPVQAIIRSQAEEFFEYYRCRGCASLVLNADPDLDAYYRAYPLQSHELNAHTRAAYRRRLKRLVRQGLRREHDILDYGCGQGLFVRFLIENGYKRARGYDPYVERFRERSALESDYDAVCSQDVIEHVPDPHACARELARLLRRDGILEIGTPRADAISLQQEPRFRFELSAPYHLQVFSEAALERVFAGAGMRTRARYRTFYFDVPLPFFNLRFVKAYFQSCGSVLECFFEKPDPKKMLLPRVFFNAWFGWLAQPKTNMTLFFSAGAEGERPRSPRS